MLNSAGRTFRKTAFSLPDLLAAAASVAVLVAIGVPAASRLGGYYRTALCLNRIGQMTQAFLAYSEDYDGVFPFVATMHDYGSDVPDPNEVWLANWLGASNPIGAINQVAYGREVDWPPEPNVPCSGTLFTYARSTDAYRCPEFERVSDPNRAQNVINYTRAIWARRWLLPFETWPEGLDDFQGPILRVNDIHKPDELPMVLDEQWNRFVATAGTLGTNGDAYNCNDYGFSVDNNIAISHGAPVSSGYQYRGYLLDYGRNPGLFNPFLWKQGSAGFYDGHAGLMRDPWPSFALGNNKRRDQWRGSSWGARQFDELRALQGYTEQLIFAQRGFDPVQVILRW